MQAPFATVLRRAERPRAAIVMAHGVMSHAGWLDALCIALARRDITAAAVDRPGSGASKHADGLTDPARWVQVLVDACEALQRDHQKVSLLGWCWGARTAILAARKFSPAHLVLAAPGLSIAAAIRARAAANEATNVDPQPLPFDAEDFSENAAVVERIRRDPLAWKGQPLSFIGPSRAVAAEALQVLPTLHVPKTIILADGDRIIDNAGVERVASTTPHTTIVHMKGGHALVLEDPDAIADQVAAAVLAGAGEARHHHEP